ncbi:MAG: hypothetical protein EOS10_31030 [Mesorhizobium sp.]|uniref:hypothetical protein n=1 Tax=Mesorhizobium sp. TaxID=1871066 RepID=UPI000FE6965C|nr:hypothetical protein [Mesorhizobium sp.]RWO25256.1 MAG: hypothetical protein EOS10_31030 [Mesorhizobium sp.]
MNDTLKNLIDDDDRILTEDELDVLTGISSTTRWRERKAGRFPLLMELSPGRKGNTLRQVRRARVSAIKGMLTKSDLCDVLREGGLSKAISKRAAAGARRALQDDDDQQHEKAAALVRRIKAATERLKER